MVALQWRRGFLIRSPPPDPLVTKLTPRSDAYTVAAAAITPSLHSFEEPFMPVVLGVAVSNSPLLYRPRARWDDIYRQLIKDVTQPNRAETETAETLDDYAKRVEAGFGELQKQLVAAKPDAVVVLSSDRGRVFNDTQVPQLSVYVGEEIWGTTHHAEIGESPSDGELVTLACHTDISAWLADELTEEKFDVNISRFFKPMGAPEDGVGQALTEPVRKLVGLTTPVVPVFINAHLQPAISGHRMPPLGAAIARVLGERDERIALVASGGLSGDPQGYLAGWVDESLDAWVLSRLRRGRSEQLGSIWDLDSNTVRGATAEVRQWIAVGAAMESLGARANVVDYIRFHHATVGTAFAYWKP